MSRALMVPALLGCLFAATGAGLENKDRPIARLDWLVGRWENVRPRLVTEESWLPAAGNTMLGVSRVVKSDSLITYELVIIREVGKRLAYEAHPAGKEPAVFTSTVVNDSTVIFENPAHDFPQRIGYRLIGADSLHAWIEGSVNGRMKRNEFPYKRSPHSK